ncbi:hypothetical protein ACJX0J_018041 [Zea mays]
MTTINAASVSGWIYIIDERAILLLYVVHDFLLNFTGIIKGITSVKKNTTALIMHQAQLQHSLWFSSLLDFVVVFIDVSHIIQLLAYLILFYLSLRWTDWFSFFSHGSFLRIYSCFGLYAFKQFTQQD